MKVWQLKAMLVNGEEQQAPEKPEKLTPVKRQSTIRGTECL